MGRARLWLCCARSTWATWVTRAWSKSDVKRYLHENAQRTVAEWVSAGHLAPNGGDAQAMLATAQSADSITVLVAGGFAGAFSQVIPLWGGGSNSQSVCKDIVVPS